jgi:O-antigen/teichoic acid export membrane protein
MKTSEKLSDWIGSASDFLKTDVAYTLKGGSFLTLGNFVSVIANFALAFFFARLLPKEIYGTYSYILAWISVLGIFALSGMDTAVIQSVSRGFESSFISGWKNKVKYGFMGTVASLLIGAYYNYNGNQTLSLAFFAAAIFIPFLNSFQIYNAYLLGKKEFKTSACYAISGQLFIALTLITALYLTNNIVYLISAYLIANFIPNFVFFIRTKLKTQLSISEEDSGLISYAKHLSLINVISVIASYLDQFLAFHFLGPVNLANYAFATAPPEQIKGLFKGLPDLALPKFSERTEEDLKKTMLRKIIILTIFTIVIVGIYIVLAPWFYKIFFPRYIDSVFLSQIFALSLLNTPPALIIGAITAHKKIKKLYWFNTVSPIFQILIMSILTPLYGLMGLILARIAARTFTTAVSLIIYYKS